MPRNIQDILDHADELAKRFENYEPDPADERDPKAFEALRVAALSRSAVERDIIEAVQAARTADYSWSLDRVIAWNEWRSSAATGQ